MSAIASIGENPRPWLDGTNTGLEFNNIPPLFAIGVIASVGENPRPQPEGRVFECTTKNRTLHSQGGLLQDRFSINRREALIIRELRVHCVRTWRLPASRVHVFRDRCSIWKKGVALGFKGAYT